MKAEPRRYPFADLAHAMGLSENAACRVLKVSGSTQQEYRNKGVTERVGDRLAIQAGLHPLEVWPEMAEHTLEDLQQECAADGCTERFVARAKSHLFCSSRCRQRMKMRRYRETPSGRALNNQHRMRWYWECREYDIASSSRRRRERRAREAA